MSVGPRLVELVIDGVLQTRWVDDDAEEPARPDKVRREYRNGRDVGPASPTVIQGPQFEGRHHRHAECASGEATPTDDSRDIAAWMIANKVV